MYVLYSNLLGTGRYRPDSQGFKKLFFSNFSTICHDLYKSLSTQMLGFHHAKVFTAALFYKVESYKDKNFIHLISMLA